MGQVTLAGFVILAWTVLAAATASVTVSWQAPTTNADGSPLTDLAGYALYYGSTLGSHTVKLETGPATQLIVAGLTEGQTLYFAVTARDTSQNESVFSDEVSYTVPLPPEDTIPPTVVQSSVLEGATNVDPTSTLTVQFSEAMNASTINGTTVQLRDAQGNLIAAIVTYDAATNTVSLNPSATLASSVTYTFTLNGLTDQAGNALAPVTLHFTTAAAPPPTLIAAYGMNAGTGMIVADSSGFGHHGTRSGATWTTNGQYGKALMFDGVNDWVTVPDANDLDVTNGLTLMAWVYPTITMTGWRTVIQKEATNGTVYYLHANSDTNQPATGLFIGSERILKGGPRLARNVWTHLAATYDGVRQRLYVNGTEVSNRAQMGSIATSSGVLRFGGNAVWGEWMRGRLDEIRLYNRALPVGDIQVARQTPLP